MKERIKELEKQCWQSTQTEPYVLFDVKKFAELIVRECLGIVNDAERGGDNEIWDNAVKFIIRDLKEHFGVKE